MPIRTMYLMDGQDRRLATEARQLAVQHGKIYIRDCLGGLRAEINPDAPQQHQTKRTP